MDKMKLGMPPPGRTLSFFGSVFFFSIATFFTIVGTWALSSNHENYKNWLAEHANVLILDTGSTFFYGMPVFVLSFTIFGCYGVYMTISGTRSYWFDKNFMKPLSGMILLGIVLLFIGKQVGTAYWEDKFQHEGYVKCSGSFVLTSKWSIDVWALNPSICMDPNLKDALRHSGGSVYEINSYYTPPAAP